MVKGFWENLHLPVIGLAPMDGVTDAAFRYVVAKYGHPDVIVTEFTSVEGIRAGALRLLNDFYYNEIERPVVAQLFGSDPSAFRLAAVVVSALGFDGIDINMGCPSKNITEKGAGAALILDPPRAQAIIRATRQGTEDWQNGIGLEDAGVPPLIINEIKERREKHFLPEKCQALPVSVKTRLGYQQSVIKEWLPVLLECQPVVISLHGRTLKQLYTGTADWEEIGRATRLVHTTQTMILGNGDILNRQDALDKITSYGVDGVLIGRAALGNPWLFQEYIPSFTERLATVLEQARYFQQVFPEGGFVRMRKHLMDYCRGENGAKELRNSLMHVSTLRELEMVLLPYLQ